MLELKKISMKPWKFSSASPSIQASQAKLLLNIPVTGKQHVWTSTKHRALIYLLLFAHLKDPEEEKYWIFVLIKDWSMMRELGQFQHV